MTQSHPMSDKPSHPMSEVNAFIICEIYKSSVFEIPCGYNFA